MSPGLSGRAARAFPTRGYGAALVEPLQADTVYRFVLGLDRRPTKMPEAELARELQDPFAALVLRRGVFPMTLEALLAALDATGALPVQRSFLVGDGGQIAYSDATRALNRQLRLAITRGQGDQSELMISSPTDPRTESEFLQLLSWDPVNEAYNFYQRQKPAWVWSGNSGHALKRLSRGRGPFDSHVNGGLVMKELKRPWSHWHSEAATIEEAIAADDPLRAEALFRDRDGAQGLERLVVKPGIGRWNQARLKKSVGADGSIRHARWLLRQVLTTTTANLASSDQESALAPDQGLRRLPLTFFFNADALLNVLGLEPDISVPSAPEALYQEGLARYGFELTDGTFHQKGDTHFAFLVPEPAFEDLDVLDKLLQAGVLTRHLAASLLMVDFPNPVYSPRRAALMRYVPRHFRPAAAAADLSTALAEAIRTGAAASQEGSPEHEVVAHLDTPGWEAAFAARLERYMQAVQARLQTAAGYDEYLRLAESRRREFRKLPLHEFRLTLPTTNLPPEAPPLEAREDGTVALKAR